MSTDRLYTQGGASIGTDGRYATDNGLSSRVLRLVLAERGHWPGGRGRKLGSLLWSIDRFDPDTVEGNVRRAIEDALDPMVSSGEISDLEITVKQVTDYGVGYTLTYTDRTTGDAASHDLTAPWER